MSEPSTLPAGSGGSARPAAPSRFPLPYRILAGLAAGVLLGVGARRLFVVVLERPDRLDWIVDHVTRPAGDIFLRLIFMTVVPLVFFALAIGVAGLGDVFKLGRVGLKTFLFTLLISGVAVAIGWFLVNALEPGRRIDPDDRARLRAQVGGSAADKHVAAARQAKPLAKTLVDIVPKNPLEEAVRAFDSSYTGGGLLSVMFFALVFGIALGLTRGPTTEPVYAFCEGALEVLLKIIGLAMHVAPFGVAALIFSMVATVGVEFLVTLAKYAGVVVLGLAIHQFVVYSALLRGLVGVSPLAFFKRIQEVIVVAFATASSNATLPTSLKVAQEKLGIPRDVACFVLTLGATANQNGTALFEGVTILFLAQLLGVELTVAQQVQVLVMSVLAGVGTAGVPGGSLPLIVVVMETVGIPGGAIGIILGINHPLDMCRTTLNVTGDITVAAWVARSEGHELAIE